MPSTPAENSMAGGAALATASRLRLVVGQLYRRFRRNEDGGLTPAQLSLLATVESFGPIRMGDLAERERVQPATLTRSVAWLAYRNLAERVPDKDDKRASCVRLSPEGAELLNALRELRTAEFARRLDRLSAAERAALERALPVIESLAEIQISDKS